jgi:hypothetical protein
MLQYLLTGFVVMTACVFLYRRFFGVARSHGGCNGCAVQGEPRKSVRKRANP